MKQCGAAVNALNQFLFLPIEMEGLSRWTLDPRFHAHSQDSNSCQPSIAEYLLVIGVHLTALTSIDPLYSDPASPIVVIHALIKSSLTSLFHFLNVRISCVA